MSARKIALEALEKLACLGNGDNYGNSHGNVIAQEALKSIEADIAQPVEPVHCPNCPDQGWYGIETGGCGPDGENDTRQMEQVQCEFCYSTENSVFNTEPQEPAVNADLLAALNNQIAATYALLEWAVEVSDEYLDGQAGLRAELANDLSKAREHSNQSRAAIAKAEKS